ncbi:MAG: hypothetical protein KJO50_05245 [Bacteroidia bacterium]|nr:hypothetical protein [Bacteroidia bacterium]MBT8229644.1 hypothetical protein [Bacteroidia bacterium]
MKCLFPVILFLLMSCNSRLPDKDMLITRFYNDRVKNHSIEKDKACLEKAIASAEIYVDSLVDQWINEDLLDTIKFPPKPTRPRTPDPIIGTVERFELDTLVED